MNNFMIFYELCMFLFIVLDVVLIVVFRGDRVDLGGLFIVEERS